MVIAKKQQNAKKSKLSLCIMNKKKLIFLASIVKA
tara:strand:+ start:219 stop:323 length:105 start_codon:yes stop_codon:yes gene_type:complete